eukprot:357523-Chlamydomonas_euryale.AAC.11
MGRARCETCSPAGSRLGMCSPAAHTTMDHHVVKPMPPTSQALGRPYIVGTLPVGVPISASAHTFPVALIRCSESYALHDKHKFALYT